MRAVHSLRGRLLLASPSLVDANFRRTVVLLGEHGDEGAMGVVLNRPSDALVDEAVPALAPLAATGELLHIGGPVQPEAVLVVADVSNPGVASELIVGDVGFLRGDLELEELAAGTRRARIYAGYAGWSPGQLEAELETSDWIVAEAKPDDLFAPPAGDLWGDVLRRKGGQFRLIATMPPDPSLN